MQALESAALSEGVSQTLKTRLQCALKEGVSLVERVQELENDKAFVEGQLVNLQRDLLKMVSFLGFGWVAGCVEIYGIFILFLSLFL